MLRFCAAFLCGAVAFAASGGLNVVVVEGQGAINNARTHTGHDPVIEVRDDAGAPVAGAVVTFQAPAMGASAVFGAGNPTFVTQTGEDGRAIGQGLRPNAVKGQFQIRVTASYKGETANAAISQTNALPAQTKSSKKIWIVALVGGAAAGGAAAAMHGHSSSSAAATTPSTSGTITPGTPSFGPPH